MKTGKLRNRILAFVLPLTLVPFGLTALAVYYFVIRSYQIQIEDEQNRLLSAAIVDNRREQESARQDLALIAGLPTIVEYLEAVSFGPQTSEIKTKNSSISADKSIQAKETAARDTLKLVFDQNPYYLQLSLVDAQGQERIKFSKLPGPLLLKSLKSEDFFTRMLIGRAGLPDVQMPVESVQPGHFTSMFTRRVERERFAGIAVLQLNAVVFERHLRPLLASHGLATFLFDDRGLVFAKSFARAEEESFLNQINLATEAKAVLTQPALMNSDREVPGKDRRYLFSIIPAESLISSMEPVAGDKWFLGVLRPREIVAEQTRTFQVIFVIIFIGALGAVIWTTSRYARRFTRPLEQMAGATSKIAAGQFDIKLVVNTGDEVEELAIAVKQMAADLKRYETELVRSAKLAAIGEMASEVSHEIQNRISGVSLWIQYLDAELDANDPKREYLQEIKQGLQGFLNLLADLKQFYKTPVLKKSNQDVNELVRDSLRYIEQRATDERINVELRLDLKLPLLMCDPEKIKSVIINLLINAVEAGGNRIVIQTGSSEVQSQAEQMSVILSVADNGGGLAESDLARIFYPFYSTKAGGSGLGLAIASNLVNAHGGRIDVKSCMGQGTTFTVKLPVIDQSLNARP